MDNDKDLAALKALAEAATPGPWDTRPITDDDLYSRGIAIVAETGKILSDEDTWPGDKDAAYIAAANPAAILSLISRIERLESEKAARPSHEVDLSGLTRAYNGGYKAGHHDTVEAQYTDIDQRDMFTYHADVVAELVADGTIPASPARDVGGLTDLTDEAIADLGAFTEGSIRDFPSFREEVESLSKLQHKPTLKLIRKSIYDTVDARVRNAVKAAQAACEVLATKAAEPNAVSMLSGALNHARDALRYYAQQEHFVRHQPDEWDTVSGEPQNLYEDSANTATVEDGSVAKQALEDIAGVEAYASAVKAAGPVQAGGLLKDDIVEVVRMIYGSDATAQESACVELARALATSPAPSVKQEAGELWLRTFIDLLEDYTGAMQETAVFNATQRSGMTVRMARPRYKKLIDHVQSLAAPSASQGEVKVPDGWQLVPVEPTLEMLDRGHHQIDFHRNGQNTEQLNHPSQTEPDGAATSVEQDMRDAWAAMLAAAPSVTDGEGK